MLVKSFCDLEPHGIKDKIHALSSSQFGGGHEVSIRICFSSGGQS